MKKAWLFVALLIGMVAIAIYTSSTAIEIVATTSGLLCVWLTAKENMWSWPIGLVNVGCFFVMFWEAKLYADTMLQVFFFILSVYGWIVWMTKREGTKVRPTRKITSRLTFILSVFLVVMTLLWGYVLQAYTDASIPYADAFIATLSLIAQYLLSSKVLENWLLWIAVDVMSVAMYAYKDLYAVAFLYLIFLFIALGGYVGWKRALRIVDRRELICHNTEQA
ncbi:nicotinamide riboside transporter PnuC [Paenibacillus sp. LjRoot153]|uniref:nicotinamide riboside transporter PnuC n=1 Tax=Paenibacillus sp. LjRoot153 TaxID=3342270 RepID=UPI003ECFC46F